MTAARIEVLANVEVEHLLGMHSGLPLVKVRAESAGTVLIGQLDPAAARQIAQHLLEAAARAEYEFDVAAGADAAGMPSELVINLLRLVRAGEARRLGGAS